MTASKQAPGAARPRQIADPGAAVAGGALVVEVNGLDTDADFAAIAEVVGRGSPCRSRRPVLDDRDPGPPPAGVAGHVR